MRNGVGIGLYTDSDARIGKVAYIWIFPDLT